MRQDKYAINMHKICTKYAKICSDPISISPMHSYAFICTNMQNMQDM